MHCQLVEYIRRVIHYINARTTVYMGVDVSRAEQFRIAFSHARWNRFDCCDDTVSNTQPMVIEPSLFSQQPSGAQNVSYSFLDRTFFMAAA